jgi:hypothetical protein
MKLYEFIRLSWVNTMRFGLGVYIAIEVKESLTINLYIIYDF